MTPTEDRPEYMKCIRRSHADHRAESWCGRLVNEEFVFDGLDHAAENGLQQGRLVACPQCVEVASAALRNGHEEQE